MPGKHQTAGAPNTGAPPLHTALQLSARWRAMLTSEQWIEVFRECNDRIESNTRPLYLAYLFRALGGVMLAEHLYRGIWCDVQKGMEVAPAAPTTRADAFLLVLEVEALLGNRPGGSPSVLNETITELQRLMDQHPQVRRKLVALGALDWERVMDRVAGDIVPAWQRRAVARWLSEGKTVERVFEDPSMSGIPWHRRSALRIQEELRAEQEGGANHAC